MAYGKLVPPIYDVGSTIKILCADDISQDISSPGVVISKIFAVSPTLPFTNSCTVALRTHDRPLLLKALDPRYSMKYRRELGLPDVFNENAFYEILRSPNIATLAARIASNVDFVKKAMLQLESGTKSLTCHDFQQPLTEKVAPGSGLLEFLSLFTRNRRTTTRKRKRSSTEGDSRPDNASRNDDISIASIISHPGLLELAACLIMEQHFNRQYSNWSTLTSYRAKGVPTLVTSCIVCTTSNNGNITYVCGGLLTLEVPGSTGRMLGTALARVAQQAEQLQYCIHEFEAFLLTLSYCNLSLRGLRPDNLVLDSSLPRTFRLVMIDAGTVKDDSVKRSSDLYKNSEEEHAMDLLRRLLGVSADQLSKSHGIMKYCDIKFRIGSVKMLDWHIVFADIAHFSSDQEAVAMAPYTAIINRIARVILLQDQYAYILIPDSTWPIPQLQKLQRVISFYADQEPSQTIPTNIANNLNTIRSGLNLYRPTTKAIQGQVSTHRLLNHRVWQQEAKTIRQTNAGIGDRLFEEWVARKFDALQRVTGIHLHRRDIVVSEKPTWTSRDTLEYDWGI